MTRNAAPSLDPALDPLTQLAIRHGCDKWGLHFYTRVYHELFGHLRQNPLRMLEIGIGGFEFPTLGGASLRMWAEYFPAARIVGIDIVEKRLDLDPRITVLQGSQDDPAFLAGVAAAHGPFDIIIDDGSHIPQHVLASFNYLFPALADGGLYVIEDVQTCFWPDRGGAPENGAETMFLARSVLESLHHTEILVAQPERVFPEITSQIKSFRAFHNIFVIEKGDNTEPSSHAFNPDNPHARRALVTLEQGMRAAPSPDTYGNYLNALRAAHEWARARAVIAEGLGLWPEHLRLLLMGLMIARESGDRAEMIHYLRRITHAAPAITSMWDLLREAEAQNAAASAGC